MKAQGKVSLAIGSVLITCFSSMAMADPVTMNDLAGRKICWTLISASWNPPKTTGYSTYSAGGKYYNDYWGPGSFKMTSNGVHVDAQLGSFDAVMEKTGAGTFKSTMSFNGATFVNGGKYCK
jgi:hypothetical protein